MSTKQMKAQLDRLSTRIKDQRTKLAGLREQAATLRIRLAKARAADKAKATRKTK
jgi:hypothetical protein